MLRTIYGFDDLGRKVPTGSYDDGLKAVGGRIFYIDSNSDETVKFYDSNFNELSNVVVGDTPSYYKVTSAGVSGKEKYYVYYEEFFSNSMNWTYSSDAGWVFENTGATNTNIGGGKINTNIVMLIDDGAYANAKNTVWNLIKTVRTDNVGDCQDWFVGSRDELEELRLFQSTNVNVLEGVTDYFYHSNIFSSSEMSDDRVSRWSYNAWSSVQKGYNWGSSVIIRSF